ncbi:cytochrome P450 [Nocardia neocaledoniensis]|uniref:cytochrome P450 n=1 Tax=Nocardia neocaledoniensis TaxID=236511 RepID=UPI0024570C16|nr:cytochrome P450 [Nocardia neocaledoniensis]
MVAMYPPGPRIPRILQTIRYVQARERFLTAATRRYGDTFTVRMVPPYAHHLVVFTRPEHIREIFAASPADLHAGESNGILRPLLGDHSVLITDEAEHARARRLLMPAFAGSALVEYRAMIEQIAAARVEAWTVGTPVHSLDAMTEITLDVIGEVVLGVADPRRRALLGAPMRRITDIAPLTLLGSRYPRLQKYGPWQRFAQDKARLDELLYAEIDERRTAGAESGTDVLSRLLAAGSDTDAPLSSAELRDQLVTLLVAGHETTSSALAWALHELATDPEQQELARRAALDGDTAYLEAVMKEALRYHWVIGGVVRKLTRDMTIGGHELPAETVVAASILLAHRRREAYPDAVFRPQRFLDGSVAPNTWLPFGGGVRRCIGAGFALMEGAAVLREILRRHTLSLPAGASAAGRVRNITHVPVHGAPILVS